MRDFTQSGHSLEPVVRVELGVGPVALVRPRELEAGAAAAAVARVVEGVVNVGGGRGRREREAAGTRVGARANHAWLSVYLVPELAEVDRTIWCTERKQSKEDSFEEVTKGMMN